MAEPEMSEQVQVLVADPEFAPVIPRMASRFEGLALRYAADGQDLSRLASGAISVLVTQAHPVDRPLLERLTGLRIVLKMGRSYHNIDAEAVRERDVVFASVPRKGPNCVAELAITLILALSKDLLISHASVAEGAYRLRGLKPERTEQWKMAFHWMRHTGLHEVRGKTLGIVGMGEIGCELALRAQAMGMRSVYTKRHRLPDELETRFAASFLPLPDLLEQSDYVCLAVPHTSETERMIGRDELALMRSSAYLVNVCRGGVVDEDALIEALAQRRLAGAGLDVFTCEPLAADSPLCRLDNVILTPHVGGGTGSNAELELADALEEVQRILDGGSPSVNLN